MLIVKKSEIQATKLNTPDPMDLCLDCWKEWMQHADKDLGYQSQKLLIGEGDGYGNEDTAQQRRDNEIAAATHAMIHSLKKHHRWAIYKKCGVSTLWNYPHIDFMTTAIDAMIELEKKLKTNIATRILF